MSKKTRREWSCQDKMRIVLAGLEAERRYWSYVAVRVLDQCSRFVVHWELLFSMDATSVKPSAQASSSIGNVAERRRRTDLNKPEIRSDRGSAYISREFREALDEIEAEDYYKLQEGLCSVICWYNEERLHSSLGWLRPVDYFHGDPHRLHSKRQNSNRLVTVVNRSTICAANRSTSVKPDGKRSAVSYDSAGGPSANELRVMRLIDEQYMRTPFFGSRQMTAWLSQEIGRDLLYPHSARYSATPRDLGRVSGAACPVHLIQPGFLSSAWGPLHITRHFSTFC